MPADDHRVIRPQRMYLADELPLAQSQDATPLATPELPTDAR